MWLRPWRGAFCAASAHKATESPHKALRWRVPHACPSNRANMAQVARARRAARRVRVFDVANYRSVGECIDAVVAAGGGVVIGGEYLHFVTGPRFGRRTTNVVK